MVSDIRTSGAIADPSALDAAIAAFADSFQVTAGAGSEPDAEDLGTEESRAAGGRGEGILPETETTINEGGSV
jgi:hypothetical protein